MRRWFPSFSMVLVRHAIFFGSVPVTDSRDSVPSHFKVVEIAGTVKTVGGTIWRPVGVTFSWKAKPYGDRTPVASPAIPITVHCLRGGWFRKHWPGENVLRGTSSPPRERNAITTIVLQLRPGRLENRYIALDRQKRQDVCGGVLSTLSPTIIITIIIINIIITIIILLL